ncbi:MAG: BatD family protein [Chitinivibrionia bacterium]|nr:BatD family protein [Chitinivibrionia bacterium]
MRMAKIIFAVILFVGLVFSQDVRRFAMTTNNTNASVGDVASVMLELQTNGAVSVNIPQFAENENFSVLSANRTQSTSTNISIVNGRRTTENTTTTRFMYQIRFNSQGQITLPPLSLNIGGNQMTSNSITFNVSTGERPAAQLGPVSVRFIRERSTLFKGEQARMTVRIQVRAGSGAQLTNDGYVRFLNSIQEALSGNFTISALVNSPATRQEVINGVPHVVYDLPFNLVPLDTGRFTVPPLQLSYITEERSGGRDPFDGFFGGMFNVRQRQTSTNSPSLSFTVNDVPRPRPANFSGIVGEVRLTASVNTDSVAVGEAITLRATLSGRMPSAMLGDIELERIPNLNIFAPERRITRDTTENGIMTTKNFSWIIIPQREGTFNIPIRDIVWFDPNSATFRTTSAGSFTVKAVGNNEERVVARRHLTQTEIATLGDDIRYIKTQFSTNDIRQKFELRTLFYVFLSIWAVALILISAKLKTIFFVKDASEQKRSKAYSAAIRDINKGKISEISAILKYLSAKTGVECGSMKYDEIEKLLESRNVSKSVCQKLTAFFRNVEMARYASSDLQKNHSKESIEILKNIDKEIK